MEIGLNRQNLMNLLWHAGVVGGSAVLLFIANNYMNFGLDDKTLGILAVVSPFIKLLIESGRKA